jgi:DNA-binding transcriptional LysR family regulator
MGMDGGVAVDVRQVRYFLEAARTLNFTRAAELCHVSQPGLTMAIKRLEEELGSALFSRSGRGLALTDFGKTMRPALAQFASDCDRIHALAHNELHLKAVPVRLGVLSTIGPVRLARFLAHVERQLPSIEVTVEEDALQALWGRMADDGLDVCIVNNVRATPQRFQTFRLYEEFYVVVLPPNDPLAEKPVIALGDLAGRPYIDRLSCELSRALAAMLETRQILLYAKFRSAREDWVQSMVLAGMGFALMPEYSVTHPDVVVRPLVEPEFKREIGLLCSANGQQPPDIVRFIETARDFHWPG